MKSSLNANSEFTKVEPIQYPSVIKRDGRQVPFEERLVYNAINKSSNSVYSKHGNYTTNEDICLAVEDALEAINKWKTDRIGVEEIQDIVEKCLIEANLSSIAKEYIIYRKERSDIRESKSNMMKIMDELVLENNINADIKRENANINAQTTMGAMLKYGSEISKHYYLTKLISPEFAQAHINGDIHIHDLDFYNLCCNCINIDLKPLFTYGFSTGHGYIRPPQTISSYAALACIVIQSSQNDCFGGQSIPKFDYDLAPGVAKTFIREVVKVLQDYRHVCGKSSSYADNYPNKYDQESNMYYLNYYLNNRYKEHGTIIGDKEYIISLLREYSGCMLSCRYELIYNLAVHNTKCATFQAMESLVHNLCTMQSRCGCQTPFSSINYGTDTTPEGRLISSSVMEALYKGLGDGETPIFPIHIFKVKDGVNALPEDPNYDLFERSIEVSAKRLFPNWVFLDAPFNLQYYKKGDPYSEVASMGCRTRVIANVVDSSREITPGRGNLFFSSINLPRLAIRAEGSETKFFASLEDKLKLVTGHLLERFEVQAKRKCNNFPFLMGQGVYLDSGCLGEEDEIREVIKHGTLTIGFIGLAESLVALTGKHHGESEESQKLGLKIVQFMREYCDKNCTKYNLNFSLIATPAEGLSGRFLRLDKKLFGIIKGVTDRDYYTNSFHVPVYYKVTAGDKLKIEGKYHTFCNGGHISYVEVDGDPTTNVQAMRTIVNAMKSSGVGYGAINHAVDRDPICGYVGVINDVCPRCGRREGEEIDAEVIERIKRKKTKDTRELDEIERDENLSKN